MRFSKLAQAAAGTVVALGALAGTGTASAAQGAVPARSVSAVCGESYHVVVPGGEAQYTVNCGSSITRVSGWIKDTAADGTCVRMKVWWPDRQGYTYSAKACEKGQVEHFDLGGRTNDEPPTAYLHTVG
ncbi:hypothetical protein ACIPEL_04775 [Streptomyces griseoviridis]